jgi:hypothetical protein
MSLVGSLEDLGLGEILQIVSLSGKSGTLWIRSPFGEGRILFDRGAIHGALAAGGPSDLRGLLSHAGALRPEELEALAADAAAAGESLEEVVTARTALDAGRLEELRERHVETVVLGMFAWTSGEFSFEIRDDALAGLGELGLRAGMNAQFLALEGARLRDEHALDTPPEALEEDADAFDVASDEAEPVAEVEILVIEETDGEDDDLPPALAIPDAPPIAPQASPAAPVAAPVATPSGVTSAERAPHATAPLLPCPAAVIVDRDLAVLEWAKGAIAPLGLRTHIFPRAELAIQRIRQYFVRGEAPLVVLSHETPADPVSGARDWSEIAARLRAQVGGVPLVLIATPGAPVAAASERGLPDAVATRPSATVLADERARTKRDALGQQLRDAVAAATRLGAPTPPDAASPDPLRSLREYSARLREPAPPSEVLRVVLDFASRHFDRALVAWVRDGEAQAVLQHGVAASGGPDDEALRGLSVAVESVAAFRKVVEGRAPVRVRCEEPSDLAFVARLGPLEPVECFVAPIESGDQVAALLWADNAPTGRAIGDTNGVEVIVHEAGLALDRAVLERALDQAFAQAPERCEP